MKFPIPYAYHAEFVRRRNRRVEKATLLATIEIDVLEVETPETPAFVIGDGHAPDRTLSYWRRFPMIDGRPARVWRLEDEGCFAEYCTVEDLARRLDEDKGTPFHTWSGQGQAAPFESMENLERKDLTTFEEVTGAGPLRSWSDDGGQARAEVIQRRAQALRVIDGMVCVSVNEPIVLVTTFSDKQVGIVVTEDHYAMPDGFSGFDEHNHGRRFRPEQIEQAREFARAAAEQSGVRLVDDVVVEDAGRRRLHLPQEAEHLNIDASHLSGVLHDNFQELPKTVALAWRRLADALDETPHGHATRDLAAAVESALGEIEANDMARVGEQYFTAYQRVAQHHFQRPRTKEEFALALGGAVAAVQASLAAWHARKDDEQDWEHEALPMPAQRNNAIQQILSELGMAVVADDLRIPRERLMEEHSRGNAMLHLRTSQDSRVREYVAIVAPDLRVEAILGPMGRPVPVVEGIDIEAFLSENARRRDEQHSLSIVL